MVYFKNSAMVCVPLKLEVQSGKFQNKDHVNAVLALLQPSSFSVPSAQFMKEFHEKWDRKEELIRVVLGDPSEPTTQWKFDYPKAGPGAPRESVQFVLFIFRENTHYDGAIHSHLFESGSLVVRQGAHQMSEVQFPAYNFDPKTAVRLDRQKETFSFVPLGCAHALRLTPRKSDPGGPFSGGQAWLEVLGVKDNEECCVTIALHAYAGVSHPNFLVWDRQAAVWSLFRST